MSPGSWGRRAAIVVAHPDDEVLWLSSALGSADRVVFCFGAPFGRPAAAERRRRAVATLPIPGLIDLALPESGAGFSVDRARARPTRFGVEIADPAARARYEATLPRLLERLRPALSGFDAVLTHNPWGEYGHAEHVQVHRAVLSLQAELGFTAWFSNYVGPLSWPLAGRLGAEPCWTERREARPDVARARRLARHYRRCGAWTWTVFHRLPAAEALYAVPAPARGGTRRPLSGETLLDVTALRPWPTPFRPALRTLP